MITNFKIFEKINVNKPKIGNYILFDISEVQWENIIDPDYTAFTKDGVPYKTEIDYYGMILYRGYSKDEAMKVYKKKLTEEQFDL